MTRVHGYLRASTDQQDASVPAQQVAIDEYCRCKGFHVVEWFKDDGVSGKSFNRPEYRRMRTKIIGGNADKVKHLVVWSSSRFGRVDPIDSIVETRDLRRAGVDLVSITEPNCGNAGFAGHLTSFISAYQNREYIERLSTDVRRGLKSLVLRGFWPSVAPLGYARLIVDNNHEPVLTNGQPVVLKRGQLKGNQYHVVLVPGDDHEQEAVRFMFHKRADEAWGYRRIAQALNRKGFKTLKGQPWKNTTVRSCLTNIAYLGHMRYGVRRKHAGVRNQVDNTTLTRNPEAEWQLVENTHPPLVTVDLFQRVADSIGKQGKRGGNLSPGKKKLLLFSSAIICKHCGAAYHCRPRKKNGKTYCYYECSGRMSGRTEQKCDGWCVNADRLKAYIFGQIQDRVMYSGFESQLRAYLVGRIGQLIRSDIMDTAHIDREIAALEEKKDRLVDGVAEGMFDRKDSTVSRKFRELDEELVVATTRKQEIVAMVGTDFDPDAIAASLVDRMHDLAGMLESLEIEDQRSALFSFCKRIVADAETREIVIETDLAGLAQEQTLPGLPIGLCNKHLPE
jgi:site-specific DNA recombinase